MVDQRIWRGFQRQLDEIVRYPGVRQFGRAWFAMNGGEIILMSPEFHEAIAETIETTPVQTSDDYLDELRSRF